MDAEEANERVIETTIDVMELAHEICLERQRQDGKEFSPDEPSILEVVAVSNLIVNMTVAGMFKKPDEWMPSPAAFKAFIDQIEPIVESKVSLALSKERLRESQARLASRMPPAPPPLPPKEGYDP